MNRRKGAALNLLIFFVIAAFSAVLSYVLIFIVQYQRTLIPLSLASQESYFTRQVREQERKQIHEHFHNLTEDINLEAWAEKSSCLICHSPYPHGVHKKIKALLNLHTEFLTCPTCHLTASKRSRISYRWYNPTDVHPRGFPYGTHIDKETGFLSETDDHYSKLTLYHRAGTQWIPVLADRDLPLARNYMKNKEILGDQEKKDIEDHFHLDIEKRGPECNSCHSKNCEIDYLRLGFDDARIFQLENMIVAGIVTGFEKIYLPDLFQ